MKKKEVSGNKFPKKVVSIHQPAYLPWLGYFHKIASSDIFVVLDTTQFEKNSYINRNRILTPQGPAWLTIPVETKGKFKTNNLTETRISNRSFWQKKHWRSIEQHYGKAPFFRSYAPKLRRFYDTPYERLTPICWDMLCCFVDILGISTRLVLASELPGIQGTKTDLLVDICSELGASDYISGALGREYIREGKFEEKGIRIRYQDYVHPDYRQPLPGFAPNLSVLDLLLNTGPESLDIIMSG
ncbi:MAG: WbqC family protein [Desulfobacterales bacterium]|nr:WbqC family protein [Desulfobacterales bacterium]